MAAECITNQCDDIKLLKAEMENLKRTVLKLEGLTDRQEKDINDVKMNQAETRVYMKQVLEGLDKLEAKIFSYMAQLTVTHSKDNNDERKNWIEFAKWIIGGTIFIIVAYLFTGGKLPQ